jgi:hypothetical protein
MVGIHLEIPNMHLEGIECTRSFLMGLTSAEKQKIGFLNEEKILLYKYYENLANPYEVKSCRYFITPRLTQCVFNNVYV